MLAIYERVLPLYCVPFVYSILGNDHFFITALLDPRFHRLIIVDDIDNCVQLLTNKLLRLEEENKLYSEYDSNISTSVKPLETTIACETHLIMPTKKSSKEIKKNNQEVVEERD